MKAWFDAQTNNKKKITLLLKMSTPTFTLFVMYSYNVALKIKMLVNLTTETRFVITFSTP